MTTNRGIFEDQPKPFLEHLEELRRTILWCLALLALGMLVAIPLAPYLFNLLRAPLSGVTDHPEQFLRSLEITGAFSIAMRIVFWSGLIFSVPFISLVLARFIFPGLTRRERRIALWAAGLAAILFAFGVWLGYALTLPVALQALFSLHDWLGIRAEWTATSYVTFAAQFLLLFGLAFELPVVLMALGALGVVRSELLRRYRRHAIVGILILAMILTPGPDVFSQLAMALPMILLYELCLWAIWACERKRRQAAVEKTVSSEPGKLS